MMVWAIPHFLSWRKRAALVLFAGLAVCLMPGMGARDAAGEPAKANSPLMRTSASKQNGVLVRTFAGRAAPPASMVDPRTGREVRIHANFPNGNDPFPVNTERELGEGGWGLRTIDRGLQGVIPRPGDAPWALNMIPFGVTVDGSILDPSGPWFDGGAPDPENPFDRHCTGWEYEVLHPAVRKLVGLPDGLPAHVQPGGLFHYHGYPDLLIANLRARRPADPLTVGYSADGYPIIDHVTGGGAAGEQPARWLFSGYVLRDGQRKTVERTNPSYIPPGKYDGLYVQDYVYDPVRKAAQIEAALDKKGEYHGLKVEDVRSGRAEYVVLDIRNGLVLKGPGQTLPGYPAAHYAYVLTPDWPQVPRLFAFEPDNSFKRIIPFQIEQGPVAGFLEGLGLENPAGRAALYANCPSHLSGVHIWKNRNPY